jgi:hypothetical protein
VTGSSCTSLITGVSRGLGAALFEQLRDPTAVARKLVLEHLTG